MEMVKVVTLCLRDCDLLQPLYHAPANVPCKAQDTALRNPNALPAKPAAAHVVAAMYFFTITALAQQLHHA